MQESAGAAAAQTPMRMTRTRPPLAAATFAAVAGMLFLCAGTEGLAQETETAKETDGPQITGFRSARFGMSKEETLNAIQQDFEVARTDVSEQPNDKERTTSLLVTVVDIFPGSGPARIAYIHGYKEKRLIQVNIFWGLPVTEEPDPDELVITANVLREYFSQMGFDPEKTLINQLIDDDVIVFRATDRQERMVLLQLISKKEQVEETEGEEKTEPVSRVVSLWLSYIEDIKAPDIFRIEKGKF